MSKYKIICYLCDKIICYAPENANADVIGLCADCANMAIEVTDSWRSDDEAETD